MLKEKLGISRKFMSSVSMYVQYSVFALGSLLIQKDRQKKTAHIDLVILNYKFQVLFANGHVIIRRYPAVKSDITLHYLC